MQRLLFLVTVLFVLISNKIYAGSPDLIRPSRTNSPKVQQFINHKDWSFVENKGQIAEPETEREGETGNKYIFHPEIKYYGHQGGVYLYCKPGMLSFVFTKTVQMDPLGKKAPKQISEATGTTDDGVGVQNSEPLHGKQPFDRSSLSALRSSISTSRTDLVLLNSNPNAEIIASDKQEYYENFYLAYTPEQGITNVHTYKTITYKSLYPHIDMVLNCKEQGMEYSFIVHPGGKVSDIQLQWNGMEGTQALANGGFRFTNSLGTLEESVPKSFTDGKLVASSFEKNGFKVGNYDKGKDLVIDPSLQWQTFFGGSEQDEANGIAIDINGNIITGGITQSSGLATSGAFLTQSNQLGLLASFNNSLSKLNWCTYYSGDIEGIAVDSSGNIYIDGDTYQNSGIATSGAYKTSIPTTITNGESAFIAAFNSSGTRTWGTYYGGSKNTIATSIFFTNHGNILISGFTNSNSNGIATTGAYQTSFNSGGKTSISEDDFIAKFSSTGSLIWGSYCAGANSNWPTSYVYADTSENIYLSGSTVYLKLATSGAFQTSFMGTIAGTGGNVPTNSYIIKFSSTGSCVWATYFGGSNGETTTGLSIDSIGNLYVEGMSNSSGLASSGAFQTSNSGEDIFVAKFSPGGMRIWSTYIGTDLEQTSYSIAADKSDGVFVSGKSLSYDSFDGNNGGFQKNGVFFVAKFSQYGNLLWSSGVSGPNIFLNVDKFSNLYIASYYSQATGAISTSGAYQSSTGGRGDFFLAKVKYFPYDVGISSVLSPIDFYCQSKTPVILNINNFGINEIDSLDIYWVINDTIQKTVKWKGKLEKDSLFKITLDTINRPPGSYYFTAWVKLPNGLVDSFPGNDSSKFYIYIEAAPIANAGGNQTICQGQSKTIGVSSMAGNSYSWVSKPSGFTSTSANPTINPTSATTYYIKQTLNSDGCTSLDSAKISVSSLPSASVISNTTICPGSSIAIGSNPISGSTYFWTSSVSGFSSTLSNPSVSPTSTTSYTLTETNSNGCTKSNSVKITVGTLSAASVISNTAICTGNSISIGASAVSGSSYFWTSSVSGFSSTVSNPSVSPASTSSYTLTETNSSGCVKSNSVTITVNPLPVATVISNTAICSGNSISIGASAVSGSSYSWASSISGFSSTSSNPSVSPTSTSSFTVTETNSNGCVNSNSVTIIVNPPPSASVISDTAICSGSAISVGAKAVSGSSYSWVSSISGYSSTVSNPSVSPTSTSSYTLTETNSNGCVKSNSVTITVNPLPVASVASNAAICYGNSISIGAAAVMGSTYSWTSSVSGYSSTSSNPSVSPASTSSYTLTETNSNGCEKSNSVTITVNPLPAASVAPNTAICIGNSISIGAVAVSGSSYSWVSSVSGYSSTDANPSVSPTSTSSYTITETNPNGCVNSNSVTITVNPLPSASVISNTAICIGNSISIGATPITGSSYSWTSTVSGYSSTISNPSVSPASTSSYTLTETNSNGCVNSNSVTITVNPPPSASVISNTAICSGSAISVGAKAVSGSSYSWVSSISGYSSTVSNPSVSPTSTSSYTLTETNSNACVKSNSVTITVNPLPTASVVSNTAICAGNPISIGAVAISGSTYSWTSSISGYSSTAANPSVSPTSTASYTLTETNSNGCIKSNSVTITVNPLPAASVISNTALCSGNSISIGASAVSGSTYSWTSSVSGYSSTSSNPSVSPASTSSYTITETDSNECMNSNSITITVNPLPSASVISNTTICSGDSISIGAGTVSGSTYVWTSSVKGFSSTVSNPVIAPISTSAYTLTETNSSQCIKSNSVIIKVIPLPDAYWTMNEKCEEISLTPDNLTYNNYKWYFGDGDSSSVKSPVHDYKSKGSYTIKMIAKNDSGCRNEHDSSIAITCLSGIISVEKKNSNISIFPNPFNTSVTIRYSLVNGSQVRLLLYDINGGLIGTITDHKQLPGDYIIDINAEKYHLQPGVYLLKFIVNDEVESRRLVKF